MARTAEQFQDALLQQRIPGWATPSDPSSYFGRLLLAWGDEFARLDGRIDDLMNELDPRATLELLPEWLRMVGLPDPCCGPAPTLALARLQLLARLNPSLRGQSIPIITALAASFGYTITIAEPEPWTSDSSCDDAIYDQQWAWAWIVQAGGMPVYLWTCDSSCDDPLAWWGNQILECVIRRRSPPETSVIFQYGSS